MNYLKQKLIEKHITQSELAKRTGISRQYISQLCNEKRKFANVKVDKIYNIATALDINLDELVNEMLE